MDQKNVTKKAYDEALKDIEKDKKDEIKKIIKATLKKKLEIEEELGRLQKKKKILANDLEDFKKGRLDLIEERQKVDELAKKTSVVRVEKIVEHHHHYDKPWYEPYKVWWSVPCNNDWTTTTTDCTLNGTSGTMYMTTASSNSSSNISGTDFHFYTSGTYDIEGKIFNL